jgi:hypothetical protein
VTCKNSCTYYIQIAFKLFIYRIRVNFFVNIRFRHPFTEPVPAAVIHAAIFVLMDVSLEQINLGAYAINPGANAIGVRSDGI